MLSGHMSMVAEVVIFTFSLESCCNLKPFVFTNIPSHNILIIVKSTMTDSKKKNVHKRKIIGEKRTFRKVPVTTEQIAKKERKITDK